MASKDQSILREVIRLDPEVQVRAVGAVLHHAADAADAAELLAMLGLLKPSDRLHQDQLCPSRALRRRLRSRRSPAKHSASTGEAERHG